MVRTITQDDVARHAGVSRSLVSYVLDGGPRPVAAETRDRILKAIEELDYRPNRPARRLIKAHYSEVAEKLNRIIMSDVFMLRRPYYADILAGLHDMAHEDDRRLLDQIRERIDNIVCVEWEMDGADSVGFNRQEAALKAARHLLSRGFTGVKYIGPEDTRVLGFHQALLEAGRTPSAGAISVPMLPAAARSAAG